MSYAIVYSSRTGNTRLLAETIRDSLPAGDCVYFGEPSAEALQAQRLYVGFWTDKGDCDEQTAAFLATVSGQEVVLFGTAGFGVSQDYFDQVLGRAAAHLPQGVKPLGGFMCQGKMPMAVRRRYEAMLASPSPRIPNLQGMIDNFDKALSHPDARDLENLKAALRSL